MKNDKKCIFLFLVGNVSDGYKAIGPFATVDQCDADCEGLDGSVMELHEHIGAMLQNDQKFIFLAGNVSEGYKAIGPFDSFDQCCEGCEGLEGWVMELHSPDTHCWIADYIHTIYNNLENGS